MGTLMKKMSDSKVPANLGKFACIEGQMSVPLQ